MKATDYAKKYNSLLYSYQVKTEAVTPKNTAQRVELHDYAFKAASDIFTEMSKEVHAICGSKEVSREVLQKAILDVNETWNKLCCIIEEEHGKPILKIDGFKENWYHENPQLRPEGDNNQ